LNGGNCENLSSLNSEFLGGKTQDLTPGFAVPAQIKRIRLKSKTSQGVFAAYLNTSKSTVQKWEQGAKRPNGPSLKLLNLVEEKGIGVLG
jgi:DNA-binding transcriptional regulator YiaG